MNTRGAKRKRLLLFVLTDALGILCALLLAYLLYFGAEVDERWYNWKVFLDPRFATFWLLWRLSIYELCGLYDMTPERDLGSVYLYGLLATVLAGFGEMFAFLMVNTFYLTTFQPSRGVVAVYIATSYILLVSWRTFFCLRLRRHRRPSRVLIVGSGLIAKQILQEIDQYSRHGHEVVGFIDDQYTPGEVLDGHPVLGRSADLPRVVAAEVVDEIIVTSYQATRAEMLDLLSVCQQTGARVLLLPQLYEVMIGKVEIHPVAGVPLIALPSLNPGIRPPTWKRTFDLVGSCLGLLLMAVLHPFIAVAIKLNSSGPVFYTQERVGMFQQRYTLYKYRTMVQDAEAMSGPTLSSENDPRVTPVGRWLRRMHLDELPQFWNVFKGEMSIVGPRPERPEFVGNFAERVPAYRFRFLTRPGMTGLAQVYSYYASDPSHKLRYDISYMNSFSPLVDLKILFLTLKVLVTGRRIA